VASFMNGECIKMPNRKLERAPEQPRHPSDICLSSSKLLDFRLSLSLSLSLQSSRDLERELSRIRITKSFRRRTRVPLKSGARK